MEMNRKWKVLAVVCLVGFNGLALATEQNIDELVRAMIEKGAKSSMTPAERAQAAAQARRRALAAAKAQQATAKTKSDQCKETSVLVEAFVVQVSTEGLAKSKVNPISKAPDSVSIDHILSCLNSSTKYAEVVSGAKVTASHNEQAIVTRQQKKYIKRTSSNVSAGHKSVTATNVTYEPYQFFNELSVVPLVKSDENITIKTTYEEISIDQNEDSSGPLDQTTIRWKGTVSVKSGVPVIAAAIYEDEEVISFLILTATIQDKQAVKKQPKK